jgi:ABC-type sugar transport system ATPase subunit
MAEEILSMIRVNKHFPGVQALDNVDFSCLRGEVHALVGHNGAGKSTLIKVLGGVYHADSGRIVLRGEPFVPATPFDGMLAGISIIHQEFNLIPDLTVAKNIYLAREMKTRLGFLDTREMVRRSREMLGRLEATEISPHDFVRDLSVNQMQLVEIAKALSVEADIIVMDEPTAALPLPDVQKLFDTVKRLKQQGVTVIYISHRMEDIFQVADRVTLMKDGRMLETLPIEGLDHHSLVEKMTGKAISDFFPPRRKGRERKVVLRVQGFQSAAMSRPVTFDVAEGEIFCITGLEGCGASLIARGLFGVDRPRKGEVLLKGKGVRAESPRDALFEDFGFLTKDRRREGLVLQASVMENLSIPHRVKRHEGGLLDLDRESEVVHRYVRKLNIRAGSLDMEVQDLSGGNQQKVVLAKWLATRCRVLIMDEPTRGVDVESKAEIYHLMRELADQGVILVVVSSDMEEVLGLSDRMLVLHLGEVTARLGWEQATEHAVLLAATGIRLDDRGNPLAGGERARGSAQGEGGSDK